MTGLGDNLEFGDGLWERPYTVTNGRTRPSTPLDLMSLVRTTGQSTVTPARLGREHAQALRLCNVPTSVAEVAAHLRQPVMVTKVLLSDLIESGALTARFPDMFDPPDPTQLKALADALRKL
ncbi:MAG TPA: DUF742 domain-containing protein [Amycolatopsis sp.]|jgi:hypothetical protein|nr:DUF742 domain-containing protein [Amycolatopsis sp.]